VLVMNGYRCSALFRPLMYAFILYVLMFSVYLWGESLLTVGHANMSPWFERYPASLWSHVGGPNMPMPVPVVLSWVRARGI